MDSSKAKDGDHYEVFLSFRGVDTRQGFTDVLHEFMTMVEIHVFRDDDELAIGDKIESILGVISSCRICMPIFSPRFAQSKWCLREVSRMVELKKTIVPIFYKVSPDDVKLKDASVYFDDFRKLEEDHGNLQEVEKWKKALKEAASNKGRTLGEKSYTKFCKELVNEVLSKLGPRKRLEFDYFVGDTNKEAMELLEMGSSSGEVIYIGIYGMGGIGKTTTAKLIYNEFLSTFDHCSFVPDVRELTKSKGVKGLRKRFYKNLQPHSVKPFNESDQIACIFKNKKVLFILDDVDSYEQIKEIAGDASWFGAGSRIILTTRDKKVVEDLQVVQERSEVRYLEMKELNHVWSLELFSKCAFGTDSPPCPYQELSKRVVAYAGGLPLTITVVGKYLRNRKVDVWKAFIERLKKSPPIEVKDRLMISYESLEDEQKAIYLDIACFFIGAYIFMDETVPIFYMWQASGLLPRWSLEVLQSRSLVKIDEYNCLWMHDQLRDLGRDIVKKKSNGDVTQQSRLWERKDVLQALNCKEKKKKIKATELGDYDTNFMHYDFSGFDSLRLLILWRPNLKQRFSGTLPQLRTLVSDGAFDFGDLVLSNLAELNLFSSDVDENWDGWNKIQGLESVKFLYVTFCENLRGTPVFSGNMEALERLDLTGCSNLAYINPSIDRLQHLTYLSFANCYALYELPEVLGCLGNLTELILFSCSSLSILHESLGNLHSLRKLDLRLTRITCLPYSIGRLEKLKYLYLEECKYLVSLPDSVGNLQSLTELCILDTKITKLPCSIGGLEKLKYLDLRNVKITTLPDSFRDLSSLVKLDLSGSKIAVLPSTMAQLSLIRFLKINECDKLQELPELPTSLIELEVKADALSKVHNLSNLQELTSLKLTGGVILDWDGSFPGKLQSLSIELLSVSRLPDLSNCSQLTEFKLRCEHSLKVLPNLSGLRKLDTLEIESCHELIEIPGIGSLHSLTCLEIRDCPSLISLENLRELQALEQLKLVRCHTVTEIPGLGELRHLDTLVVEHYALRYINLVTLNLNEIPNPEKFGCQLASLHVQSFPSLLDLENLRELQQLKHLKLVGSQKLTRIAGLGDLRGLTTLIVEDCESLENLDNLAELRRLKVLTLIGCEGITQIPGIGKLQSLTSLCIEKCPSLVSLENVGELKELRKFNLILCQRLTEITGLSGLTCLTELRVEDCSSLERLDDITGLRELKQLSLIGCRKLTKIRGIVNLESLRMLNIRGCYSREISANVSELEKLYNVKVLGMPNLDLNNVDGINPSHVELQSLDLLQNLICDSSGQLEKVSEDVEGNNGNRHHQQFDLDLNLHCPQDQHATEQQRKVADDSEEYSLRKGKMNWLSSLEEITLKLRLLDISDNLSLRL